MALIVVVLPAPFGPRKPKNSPASTRSEISSTAVKSPYAFDEMFYLDGRNGHVLGDKSFQPLVAVAAKRRNELSTLRNPAIGQLGCNFLHVEFDAAVLDFPTAVALGKNRVAGARVAVFWQAGGRDVDEQLAAPNTNVRKMQVAEGNRRGTLFADQPLQRRIIGIGPKMLVVRRGIGVHDEQLLSSSPMRIAKGSSASHWSHFSPIFMTRPIELRRFAFSERFVLRNA